MRIWPGSINSFLGALLIGVSLSGLVSAEDTLEPKPPKRDAAREEKAEKDSSKRSSTIRLHMETEPNSGASSGKIKLLREHPVTLNVEKDAFTDEGFIEEARIIDTVGGYMLMLKFNTRGALRMQMWTVSKPGRHIAVWSRWNKGARWLGAPLPPRAIEDGVLYFTPDATREEAEWIRDGLNNAAIKLGNQKKAAKPKKPSVSGKPGKGKDGSAPDEEMFQK